MTNNIHHPLATLEWSKGKDVAGQVLLNQAVFLHDSIYVGLSLWRHGTAESNLPTRFKVHYLYCIAADLCSWEKLTTANVENYALTCYQSQLVLVGGTCMSTMKALRKLLVSTAGTNWQPSLPPMPTSRSESVAFSTGQPEYLVVAGGVGDTNRPVDVVEVLVRNEWFSLCPLPLPCCQVRVAVHYGNVYLMGGPGSYYCQVFCRLESLKAACAQASAGRSDIKLWGYFRSERRIYSPVSFGGHLMEIGRRSDSNIHAYFPSTQSWVHVGDLPSSVSSTTTLVTPSGELVVIGRQTNSEVFTVLKASLRMSPYDPDDRSQFSVSALSRLEAAGIQLMAALEKNGAPAARAMIKQWQFGGNPHTLTWRSLLEMLNELYLEELGHQIEKYLKTSISLKEQCTSVIISALLQQNILHPDDLQVRLPEYVPPTVKRSITHTFRAHIHAL